MQYRHVFHAGNFADVHKHITLLQLLESLKKKAKGFLYLDTHAGEGIYDLSGADARHSAESEAGFGRLQGALSGSTRSSTHAAIRHYLEAVAHVRDASGNPHLYPGSPLLTALALRDVDAAICVESEAPIARALQRALAQLHASVTPRVLISDGYHEVKVQLPPPSRRGLILIDPPYETPDEERHLAAALAEGLTRFETGTFAVWYPIKQRHDTDLWLARVIRGIARPTLAAEFCLHAPDHGAGLNGSGMLVVNPPWQFDTDTRAWQTQLEGLLDAGGGSRVRWLVREGA
jgi:23S rRNA (adenine2030-N6)-methyltransferase